MPNNIAKNYYPVSQRFFQDLLSRFSPPLSSPSSNWAKRSTLPRWFNPLPVPFCIDLFAASPDFWERASGAWRRSQRPLCTSSFIPCGSKPIPFSFLLSMTPSPRRQGRKFQDVPGIEIILRRPREGEGTLMKIITLHPLVIVVEGFYASASKIRRTWDTSPCDGTGNGRLPDIFI